MVLYPGEVDEDTIPTNGISSPQQISTTRHKMVWPQTANHMSQSHLDNNNNIISSGTRVQMVSRVHTLQGLCSAHEETLVHKFRMHIIHR